MKKPIASIIIRVKNEARWLPRCLAMLSNQVMQNFEIILVDNMSTDSTLEIAERFGIQKIAHLDTYTPGKALNLGAQLASGEFLVFLSAHCVPYDEFWLQYLIEGFERDPRVQGVYGRQIPLPGTADHNARDLLSVFRIEERLQSTDYFFHNANSAVKVESWLKTPFDESVNNLEDQVWAKQIISAGGLIFYEPKSLVYHNDGLHFQQSPERTSGVIKALRNLNELNLSDIPAYSKERLSSWYSFCLFDSQKNSSIFKECLENYIQFMQTFNRVIRGSHLLVSSIDFFTKLGEVLEPDEFNLIKFYDRTMDGQNLNADVDILEIMQHTVESYLYTVRTYPEAFIYFNPQYPPTTDSDLSNVIWEFCTSDADLVVLGKRVEGLTWIREADGSFKSSENFLKPNTTRNNVFEVFLGAGSAFSLSSVTNYGALSTKNLRIIETYTRPRILGGKSVYR